LLLRISSSANCPPVSRLVARNVSSIWSRKQAELSRLGARLYGRGAVFVIENRSFAMRASALASCSGSDAVRAPRMSRRRAALASPGPHMVACHTFPSVSF
jgi:hypothetical protein